MRRQCVADRLRAVSAELVLDDTPCTPDRKKKVEPPTKSIEVTEETPDGETETVDIPLRPSKPDEISKKIKQTARPNIKPPRRIKDFKAKWKGDGSREVRKDYQQQYRMEHGNGYAKKIHTSSKKEGAWEQAVEAVFGVHEHRATRISTEN